ncbi:MAG: glycosyl transferase [Hyphomicrobiales bacterium]|nr:MAG: glycosyl transferase [Hyphomicrobiales bacterium]
MADFHQNPHLATLHNFKTLDPQLLERELEAMASRRKVTLILPSLFSELEGEALAHIVDELCEAKFLNHIIIGLDRADAEQYRYARQYFARLPIRHDVVWNDGPRMMAIDKEIEAVGLSSGELGKGRNVWYSMGLALANGNADVIALHDCDIVTYTREMLVRLVYPVINPTTPYMFCKGFYPRIADGKLNGRVSRLLVGPLLAALERTIGAQPYLDYLAAFRYPLAGEFAMRSAIVPQIRIPSDWGLEIGVLSEVWRNLGGHSVCQVDISDAYDHKHQPLSEEDPTAGLSRMSTDISKALFRKMASDGIIFNQETFRTLKGTYLRAALDLIEAYYHDARMNGLHVDRHAEEQAVELFAANIVEGGQSFLDNPLETPFIPNWNRVQAANPDIMRMMIEAVKADAEEFS